MFIFDVLFAALIVLLPLIALAAVMLFLALLGPRLISGARQRAYDEASAAEAVRLTIAPPPGIAPHPELATELIRAFHPRQRRGFGFWKVGWPLVDLSVLGRGGELSWEITTNAQMAAQVKHALRALFPGTEVSMSKPDQRAAVATAVGTLAASAVWPLGEAGSAGGRPLNRLAAALETVPDSVDVRLRLLARPLSASAWREATPSAERPRSLSMGQLIGSALVEGVLFMSSSSQPAQPPPLAPEEREARSRKRRGAVGFDVGLLLEVVGTQAD